MKRYTYRLYTASTFKPPPPPPILFRHSINVLLANLSQSIPELDGQIKEQLAKEMAACMVEHVDLEEILEAILEEIRQNPLEIEC